MKIQYKQQFPVTLVRMCDSKLVGVSSCRPGDEWSESLGLAVAIVKASKRIPSEEVHFLKKLKKAPWKSIRISEADFGTMLQYTIGYRTVTHPGIRKSEADFGTMLQYADGGLIVGMWGQKPPKDRWKTVLPPCILAERIAKDLLGKMPVLSQI